MISRTIIYWIKFTPNTNVWNNTKEISWAFYNENLRLSDKLSFTYNFEFIWRKLKEELHRN